MKTPITVSSKTDCNEQRLLFQDLGTRKVVADFSGGTLSSDAGVLLLREVDAGLGLSKSLAQCFSDLRQQHFVDHSVQQMVAQRVYGFALAGASTLNRLELSNNKNTRCHKLPHDPAKIEACLLEMGARCLPKHIREAVVDLDAMGHRLHGSQEGRRFNAYYDDYCYLPLYAFVGDFPLWAQLRTAERGAAHGVVAALEKIVAAIRKRCRRARIIVRGDSGFCRDDIMAWCESQPGVYYCLGMIKNPVLLEKLGPTLAEARARHCLSGATSRAFGQFVYRTLQGWSRSRRVVGKAEVMREGENPRFVVTNLAA